MYIPRVVKIIHRISDRGEFFTVFWDDNTKTTVKLAEGENSDEYTAFLYALGKKLFSNKGTAKKFIQNRKQVFEDEVQRKSEYNRMRKNRKTFEDTYTEQEVDDFLNEIISNILFNY